MAFANLFTTLSAVDEEVRSPAQPAFAHSREGDGAKRGNARKRKTQGGQPGPDGKKQRCQDQTSRTYNTKSFKDDDSTAVHRRMQNADSEHASTKEVIHNHSYKAGHKNMHHKGQNNKGKNMCNANKQEQQKKKKGGQKNQHPQRDRGGHTSRGGRHQSRPTWRRGGRDGRHKDGNQDAEVNRPRFMTQEFKDQNALLVDGQLLCRHFLWGRCIKGDDCQLKHIQGYNNLIKEICKFYVQGLCMKGESCPYMHKSFPCKFFHRIGKCSQGADCRFSHEPLNEVTKRLLDEALKRENDLHELAKKAGQESSGQPANTDESETVEANRTPDIPIQPLRPNFYNSGKTNTEQEALLCQTEELSDITETAAPPQASDRAQPHRPLSPNLNHEEPVCYSVEAVLGPQLFKPFPSFFTLPGSRDSVPLSVAQTSSHGTSGSVDQSKVPYSVDAVRSCKSGLIPTPPPAQTVSYNPRTDCEEHTDSLQSSETEKVQCSLNTRNEANKSQEKMCKSLPSLQVHTDPISMTCPVPTLASHKKQGGEIPASLKPAQGASHEVKLELLHSSATVAEKTVPSKGKGDLKGRTHLPMDIIYSMNCKSEGVHPFAPTKRKSLTFTPKHPAQVKPHLSGLTCNSQASVKPLCPSSGLSEFKGEAAVCPEKTRQNYSTETTDLSAGCNKMQKIPFSSLFASPITDSLMATPDFVTPPACPQGFIQTSCPTLQSTHCRSKDKHVKTAAEPDRNLARPFLSLFAAPLSVAPLQGLQSQPDSPRTASCPPQSDQSADSSHLSDSKQRASDVETPLSRQVRTDGKQTSHRPTSPKLSDSPENENDDLSQPVKQPTALQVNSVCSLVSDSLGEISSSPTPCGDCADPSTTQAHQQLPNISSPTGSAAAATTNSVLKTLFLCLSPYQQDGEQQDSIQISVPSESESDKSSTKFVKQQRKREKKSRRKKKLRATVGSTLSSPAMTDPLMRNSDAHNSQLKPVTQLMPHHIRPRLKHTSSEGKWVNGNVALTPLKDLFKTLDTTVFHFGH